MDKKPRVRELLENASRIDSWLDPLSKDKSRLVIIQELVTLWDVTTAQRIIQDLYLEKSIQIAESMISWNRGFLNIEDNSYLRVAEKQSKSSKSENWNFDLKKEQIIHDINKQRKDEYYESIKWEKILREQKKKVIIKWKRSDKKKISKITDLNIREKKEKKERLPALKRKEASYNFFPFEVDGKIVIEWHKKWRKISPKKKRIYENFIFLWISFNAFYENVTPENSWDRNAWEELCTKKEIVELWGNIKDSIEIKQFKDFLKVRPVFKNDWTQIAVWWLWNCQKDKMFENWDFWDNPKEFIDVIYRIRNNLFHWWKILTINDTELLDPSIKAFIRFLDTLYWFSE